MIELQKSKLAIKLGPMNMPVLRQVTKLNVGYYIYIIKLYFTVESYTLTK